MGEIKYKFVEGLNAGANGRSPLQGLCVLTFASTAVSYFLNCFSTALTKKSLGTNRGTLTKS